MGKLKRDRASNAPGGMECCACGSIFIGDESHDLCAVCQNASTLNLAEMQEALVASEQRVAQLEKALHHYTEDKWAPVADYSDNYWYQSGKAPWKHADAAIAASRSTGAADVGEDHG